MEMVRRHGSWLLRKVVFMWLLLPSQYKWKQNCFYAHYHRKKNCTRVPGGGRNWRGCVFVFWNGRVVRAPRAPAGSTPSSPPQGSAPHPAVLLHGWPRAGRAPGEGRSLRSWGALVWGSLAEMGLLCGLSKGTWRVWAWDWLGWVKSVGRPLFKVLTYPPACRDCLSSISRVNATSGRWTSLFLGKSRHF